MTAPTALFVVAGELSGDLMAAAVIQKLGVPSFGMGGSTLGAAGTELLVGPRSFGGMGLGALPRTLPKLVRAYRELEKAVAKRHPRAALLAGFSEFNLRLGRKLRARGIRVVWYAPPQVWAWRVHRANRVRAAADALAVTLPFEEAFWRERGSVARYVGHPALERVASLSRLGTRPAPPVVGLLPGSRPEEVRRHLPLMLSTAKELSTSSGIAALAVRAPSLARRVSERFAAACDEAGIPYTDAPLPEALGRMDLALCASGTATLECALAEVPPVIVYKTDPLMAWIARRTLLVPHVGLPNLVLESAVFPELLQERASAPSLASACRSVLTDLPSFRAACIRVRQKLMFQDASTASENVAEMLRPWL